MSESEEPVLAVEDMVVTFRGNSRRGRRGTEVQAVDGVSFSIMPGETVGLVGESGSGKSTIGRAVLGLQPLTEGRVRLAGRDITNLKAGSDTRIAKLMQVVFQDPYSSLNPSRTVGRTLSEPLEVQGAKARDAVARIQSLLDSVGLPSDAAARYPHGFSGGQRQRIAIARALSTSPQLVICDEAVSALDLVTRAQVLNLLSELQQESLLAFLFIAHDLPIVSHVSHRTVVLYRGRVMEQGPARVIHEKPLHPYTQALLAAVPLPKPAAQRQRRQLRQHSVRTTTANAGQPAPEGCPFAPRCPFVHDVCTTSRPADTRVQDVTVACHLYDTSSGHPDAAPQPATSVDRS